VSDGQLFTRTGGICRRRREYDTDIAQHCVNGNVVTAASVGIGADVLGAMDFALARLYSAAESGIVTVFDTRRGGLRKIGQAVFAPYAHVVGVDERSHRVYFQLANIGGQPVLRVATPIIKELP
jgi:hypothetical protein